ncbi:hypothetical protein GCM10010460_05810 [Microbacterium terrae]|nr:hypothetical protein GCM10017594_03400 [Microbacterium terrae]
MRIDGVPVSEAVLAPGWSSYPHRLAVEEVDITLMIRDGALVEVLVGNGWWRGGLGFVKMGIDYGSEVGFAAEILIQYADTTSANVATSMDWRAHTSAVGQNSIYDGEVIDATLAGRWLEVVEIPFDSSVLVPQVKPPIVRHEALRPVSISSSSTGSPVIDFGQNLVGWVRLRARGEPGTRVTVRHAEVLEGRTRDATAARGEGHRYVRAHRWG